ncbi:cell division protein FtsQ/DivIB [Staphylococcus carnosus]|uniref:Cell division protein DivIB n=1 Tax=Staphylococcus carnosus (strain TM300) TaxID=396513 RepID=B9DPR4_STACT|nr:FtsQ-type POTRA domain-containing protein [Staphylococcus carnosus]QPT03869.1 FtsQ-type POTRA domain-containing protein [Staphylococcus carnosus]UQA66594.1 FtsQ-type POTRA domain-containing protein [Staphylococcus carnosus]UTB78576.1 hypothetical protein A2I62_08420 [Staphylococcus carnosus]UTB88125.1 hypothetical protein A2I63_08410 [Staphylococcus carnosus]UTB90476.1 hypothetical protein A2I64_08415 [Staphylococcus carnosus]
MSDKVRKIDSEYLKEKRRKRRERQRRIQLSVFGVLIALIALIILYMFTPISRIDQVRIKGTQHVDNSEVKKALNINKKTKIYTFSKGKAIAKLKKNPYVKNVEINRQFPNDIEVKVTEYQLVGLIEEKGKYYPVLDNDHILKDDNQKIPEDAPVISGFSQSKRAKIIQALSEMKPDIRSSISEVEYADDKENQNQIKLFMKDNIQVLGNISMISDKLKYYPEMSKALERDDSGNLKKSGYIDLSVGASFIPYNEGKTTSSESSDKLREGTAIEDKAKDELQNTLNKINEQSKDSSKDKLKANSTNN